MLGKLEVNMIEIRDLTKAYNDIEVLKGSILPKRIHLWDRRKKWCRQIYLITVLMGSSNMIQAR